ncbi:prolyl oligopeptidase [Paraphysoderma sedebokerense]|nr:prolyl oligopeptidase [Paraphysoderma sedebokerense]
MDTFLRANKTSFKQPPTVALPVKIGSFVLFSILLGLTLAPPSVPSEKYLVDAINQYTSRCLPRPPLARKIPSTRTLHNHSVPDDFAWMRNATGHEQSKKDLLKYVSAENAYTDRMFRQYEKLQESLLREMKEWEDLVVPDNSDAEGESWESANYMYYLEHRNDQEYDLYMRKPLLYESLGSNVAAEVVLDLNEISANSSYFALGVFEASPSDTLLAYSIDSTGNEQFSLYIKNLTSKELICGGIPIQNTYYAVRWAREDSLYFNVVDDLGVPRAAYRFDIYDCNNSTLVVEAKKLGKWTGKLVYEENDQSLTVLVSNTNDQQYVNILISGQVTSSVLYISTENVSAPSPIHPILSNIQTELEHRAPHFYLRTNLFDAPNFQVIRIPNDTALSSSTPYEPVIVHNPHRYIERIELFERHLVAWTWYLAKRQLLIVNLELLDNFYNSQLSGVPSPPKLPPEIYKTYSFNDHTVYLVLPATISDMEDRLHRRFNTNSITFTNSSYTQPPSTYRLNLDTLVTKPIKTTKLRLDKAFPVSPPEFTSQRLWISNSSIYVEAPTSKLNDSIIRSMNHVPVDIVYQKHHESYCANNSAERFITDKLPGFCAPRPILVSAYGAYGGFIGANFDPHLFSLMKRGLCYAQIHPRGDGDLGYEWYASGHYLNKSNTFFDIATVLQQLVNFGLTKSGSVALKGRSAGGLVAGVAVNNWGFMKGGEGRNFMSMQSTKSMSNTVTTKSKELFHSLVSLLSTSFQTPLISPRQTSNPSLPNQSYRRHNHQFGSAAVSSNIPRLNILKLVIGQVSFVDVITDMIDDTVPWTAYEWTEWGNPHNIQDYGIMMSYSPYDNLMLEETKNDANSAGNRNRNLYPTVYFTAGKQDSRVQYFEPTRFVAKLRHIQTYQLQDWNEAALWVPNVEDKSGYPLRIHDEIITVPRDLRNVDKWKCEDGKALWKAERNGVFLRVHKGGHFGETGEAGKKEKAEWFALVITELGIL